MTKPKTRADREARWQVVNDMRRSGATYAVIAAALGMREDGLRRWMDRQAMLREKVSTARACMVCRDWFPSEGRHNRLCPYCSRRAADASPFEPSFGTERGMRQRAPRS